MKFKVADELDKEKHYTFLRTLQTEKRFKDRYDVEFNAQLGAILAKLTALDKNPTAQAYADIVDLRFGQTRDKIVDAMYAKRNDEGGLYQNEETAEECQHLIDSGHINPTSVILALLKSI